MRAVADTGPLHYLVLLNAIDLLPQLFEAVWVPAAVQTELTRSGAPAAVREWAKAPPAWLTVVPIVAAEGGATKGLDEGERAVIRLAQSVSPDLVLMDDRAGVAVVRAAGLLATGTIGLLIRAADRGLLDLEAAFTSLKATSFYARSGLFETLLARHRPRRAES